MSGAALYRFSAIVTFLVSAVVPARLELLFASAFAWLVLAQLADINAALREKRP